MTGASHTNVLRLWTVLLDSEAVQQPSSLLDAEVSAMLRRGVWILSVFLLHVELAKADLVYSVVGSTTTVDFTGFTGAGFQANPTAGQLDSDDWASTGMSEGDLAFGGSRTVAPGDYARGTTSGGVTAGGFYAVTNITAATGVSFGIQPIGNDWTPGTLTLQIRNNTGVTLDSISVGYDLFVRNDEDRSNSFNFSYAVGPLNSPGAFAASGSPSDSFTSTAGADGLGWVSQRSTATLTTIATQISNGQSIFLRWSGDDVGGSGSRDEFAIDNITFSGITAVPEPSSFALLSLAGCAAWGMAYRRRVLRAQS